MMKKLSEKLKQYLSLKTIGISPEGIPPINILSDGSLHVTSGKHGNVVNQFFSSLAPLKVASGMVDSPVSPIVVYWDQKMVYYREGLNASQIYSAFQVWLDKPDSMDLSTADGPYERDYENVPDMIIRTMEFKVGSHDIITMTVIRAKKDWEFIEVTKEMLAGMQEDLS